MAFDAEKHYSSLINQSIKQSTNQSIICTSSYGVYLCAPTHIHLPHVRRQHLASGIEAQDLVQRYAVADRDVPGRVQDGPSPSAEMGRAGRQVRVQPALRRRQQTPATPSKNRREKQCRIVIHRVQLKTPSG